MPTTDLPGLHDAQALNIGVLTFHSCINYGSYWQSRCLHEGLRARGHRAVLLDLHSPRIQRIEWRCALRPVLSNAAARDDLPLYAHKTRKFLSAAAALPRSRRFSLEDPSDIEGFNVVVVGSDEVWNLAHPWYGHQPLFFGHGLRAPRVVSYAASFGNHAAERGLPQPWAAMLANFRNLSVRDENSSALVHGATGTRPALVLDPCLQFTGQPAYGHGHVHAPLHARAPRYVAVYGHDFSAGFAARVRAWADWRRVRLVSIGYRNDWCDVQWLAAGPLDFARFMSRATAVATNFFHGCVFALRHQRPFVCEDTAYRAIKVRGLMSMLDGASPPAGAAEHRRAMRRVFGRSALGRGAGKAGRHAIGFGGLSGRRVVARWREHAAAPARPVARTDGTDAGYAGMRERAPSSGFGLRPLRVARTKALGPRVAGLLGRELMGTPHGVGGSPPLPGDLAAAFGVEARETAASARTLRCVEHLGPCVGSLQDNSFLLPLGAFAGARSVAPA
jgi:hypothetical protein